MSCVICLPSKVDMRRFAWGVFFKPSCGGQKRTEHRGHRVTTHVGTFYVTKNIIDSQELRLHRETETIEILGRATSRKRDEVDRGGEREGVGAYTRMHHGHVVGTVGAVVEITVGAVVGAEITV